MWAVVKHRVCNSVHYGFAHHKNTLIHLELEKHDEPQDKYSIIYSSQCVCEDVHDDATVASSSRLIISEQTTFQ